MTNAEIAEVWADQETRDGLLRYVGEVPPSRLRQAGKLPSLVIRREPILSEGPELLEAEKAVSKAVNRLMKSIGVTLSF